MGEQSAAFSDIWDTLLAQAVLFLTYPASNLSPTLLDSPAIYYSSSEDPQGDGDLIFPALYSSYCEPMLTLNPISMARGYW